MTRPEALVGRSNPGVLLFSVQEIHIGGLEGRQVGHSME